MINELFETREKPAIRYLMVIYNIHIRRPGNSKSSRSLLSSASYHKRPMVRTAPVIY